MALTPNEITRHITQAEQAFDKREYNQAIAILNTIVQKNPDYAPAYRQMGSILMHSLSQEKALPYFKKALELSPDDAENWMALGVFHQKRKEWSEALKAFHQALRYRSEDRTILHELLQIYRTIENFQVALTIVEKLRKIDPENIQYQWKHAQLLKETGSGKEALAEYDQLINSGREGLSVEVVDEWHELTKQYSCPNHLRSKIESAYKLNPDNVMLEYLYILSQISKTKRQKVSQLLQEVYEHAPENIKINQRLYGVYNVIGLQNKAAEHLDIILKIDPLNTKALLSKSTIHKYRYGDSAFRQLNFAAAHIAKFSVEEKSNLHYALGKAYDDAGDPETAFEHYRAGGALNSQDKHYKEYANMQHLVTSASKLRREVYLDKELNKGYPSKKPVFVVGMPRSGTSLIEQVLSSMEGVYGAGELEYSKHVLKQMDIDGFKLNFGEIGSCFPENRHPIYEERGEKYLQLVEALAPKESRRIIDKAPHNFLWLGHLHLILPNASIVHSRRHPVETCLSAYRIHFAKGQYWSDDLRMMGKSYRLYSELMQHWKSILPEGTILDVRYEDTVSDLERESKRLAAHIGMPWDASCLAFHESKRPVRTASVSQVRKPIYNTSINRWHKYEPYLKPLLDEIGDIVEAYEAELAEDDYKSPFSS